MRRHYARHAPLALAAAIALVTVAAGARASTTPAASRLELAPTPSPFAKPLLRASALDAAQRTLDIKQIVTQRMATLSRLQPRTFTSPRSLVNVISRQEVQVAGHLRSVEPFAQLLRPTSTRDRPCERERNAGRSADDQWHLLRNGRYVRITGTFPFESGGLNLPIESWADTVVKVRLFGNAYGSYGARLTVSRAHSISRLRCGYRLAASPAGWSSSARTSSPCLFGQLHRQTDYDDGRRGHPGMRRRRFARPPETRLLRRVRLGIVFMRRRQVHGVIPCSQDCDEWGGRILRPPRYTVTYSTR